MPRSSISRWKPRFVIVVTATVSTFRSSARTARIWSPSSGSPFPSTASIRSPSPSNATPRSRRSSRTSCWSARRSVAPQPTLMFVPSGSIPIAVTSAPSSSKARGAIHEYAPFAQSTPMPQPLEVGAEAVEDVVEVAVDGDLEVVDLAVLHVLRRRVEQRLDRLLVGVGELAPVLREELDAVVLGRVVGGGDDDAEVEREQRDRRRRQDAGEHRVTSRRGDAARERALELRPGGAGVAADEDCAAPGPERGRTAEPLDELRGQVLADDPAHTVGAEVTACHVEALALGELRGLAGLVQAGLLALDDAGVAREEAFLLQDAAELRIGLDERAGDAVAAAPRPGRSGRRRAPGRAGRTCLRDRPP